MLDVVAKVHATRCTVLGVDVWPLVVRRFGSASMLLWAGGLAHLAGLAQPSISCLPGPCMLLAGGGPRRGMQHERTDPAACDRDLTVGQTGRDCSGVM